MGISFSEDVRVSMELLLRSETVVVNSTDPLYFYRMRGDSAVHTLNKIKLESAVTVAQDLLEMGAMKYEGKPLRVLQSHFVYRLLTIETGWVSDGNDLSREEIASISQLARTKRINLEVFQNFRHLIAFVVFRLPVSWQQGFLQSAKLYVRSKSYLPHYPR